MVNGFLQHGLLAKAIQKGLISITIVNPRDFSDPPHHKVDEKPYGGGPGMVLKIEPLVRALRSLEPRSNSSRTIVMSAKGNCFTQQSAEALSKLDHIVLVAGRYEGIDQRFIDHYCDEEMRVGDAVLMGGEAPALSIMEAVARLRPGVLGNALSLDEESLSDQCKEEYPQYTRPPQFEGHSVPEVLIGGNHKDIEAWRATQTRSARLEPSRNATSSISTSCNSTSGDSTSRNSTLRGASRGMKALYVALIHYPVVDRNGATIASSVTNLDLHDIGRSARTFDVKRYFVVHPSDDEQALNRRIIQHWKSEFAKGVHPTRQPAVSLISLEKTFEAVLEAIRQESGEPFIVATSAKNQGAKTIEDADLVARYRDRPVLLLFGTGYGLHPSWQEKIHAFLPPIIGSDDYNHLSVRSAVAIYLDRLFR